MNCIARQSMKCREACQAKVWIVSGTGRHLSQSMNCREAWQAKHAAAHLVFRKLYMLPISNYCAASIFCEYFLQVNYDIWQADTQIAFVNGYIYLLQYVGLIINTSGWYVNLILHCVICFYFWILQSTFIVKSKQQWLTLTFRIVFYWPKQKTTFNCCSVILKFSWSTSSLTINSYLLLAFCSIQWMIWKGGFT